MTVMELEPMDPRDFINMLARLGRIVASSDNVFMNQDGKTIVTVHCSYYFAVTYERHNNRSLYVKLVRPEDGVYFCIRITKGLGPDVSGNDYTMKSFLGEKEFYTLIENTGMSYNSKEEMLDEIEAWKEDYL